MALTPKIHKLFYRAAHSLFAQIPGSISSRNGQRLESLAERRVEEYYRRLQSAIPIGQILSLYKVALDQANGQPFTKLEKEGILKSLKDIVRPAVARRTNSLFNSIMPPTAQAYYEGAFQINQLELRQQILGEIEGYFMIFAQAPENTPWPNENHVEVPDNFPVSMTPFDRPVPQHVLDIARRISAQQISGIDQATTNQIARFIAAEMENQIGVPALAAKINERWPEFGSARARLIANMEMNNAISQGAMTHARELGKKTKEAITVGDDRVRLDHSQNESDGIIPIDRTFSGTGHLVTPFGFNCRCAVTYYRGVWRDLNLRRRPDPVSP